MPNQLKGILFFINHCFLFSVVSGITKELQSDGLSVSEVLLAQTIFGSLILLPFVAKRINKADLKKNFKWHFFRSLFWVLPSLIFFYSMNYIDLAKAMSLAFAVPLFTTIMAIFYLKEKFNLKTFIALIAGFVGMLIIIKPGFSDYQPEALYCVVAAVLWSISDIILKLVGKKSEANLSNFYFAVISVFIILPFAVYHISEISTYQFALLLALSCCFTLNMYSINRSYQLADLTVLMPFKFTMLIFSTIISYIFFGNPIAQSTIIGAILIIASTMLITRQRTK